MGKAAPEASLNEAISAIWRIESASIVAAVARRVRDVGLAEELAQDAMVAALERWPADGIPEKPGAWLMTTAINRSLDWLRHRQMSTARHDDIAQDLQAMEAHVVPDFTDSLDHARELAELGDDLLRLMFTACHPVLSREARVALTLKLLGGLSTQEIARAYLVPEPTIAQRIVRAKRTLADEGVPFEVPRGDERHERLSSVLEVIYLVFNEGYTATAGDDWMRPALCQEALRLIRMLAELAPDQAEALGLAALLELQASRIPARTDPDGTPVLLADQNRLHWDHLLIRRGLAALERADALATQGAGLGSYHLQASIAACHARAAHVDQTDWAGIARLYAQLLAVQPSPVIELNRAVAVGYADGPSAALPIVEHLEKDKRMQRYHLLPAVKADLLIRMERHADAAQALERALDLTSNAQERLLLTERLAKAHQQASTQGLRR